MGDKQANESSPIVPPLFPPFPPPHYPIPPPVFPGFHSFLGNGMGHLSGRSVGIFIGLVRGFALCGSGHWGAAWPGSPPRFRYTERGNTTHTMKMCTAFQGGPNFHSCFAGIGVGDAKFTKLVLSDIYLVGHPVKRRYLTTDIVRGCDSEVCLGVRVRICLWTVGGAIVPTGEYRGRGFRRGGIARGKFRR